MECKKRIPQDTCTVDIKKKKIVSLVTSEEVYDGSRLKKLVDNASENNDVKKVIADGAYDSKENFRYLFHNQIEARSQGKEKFWWIDRLLLPKKNNSTCSSQRILKDGRLKLTMDQDGWLKQYSLR